jgi:hypothetical protein
MDAGLIIVGSLIVTAVFSALIVGTARVMGWKEAALVWGFSAAMTAVLAAGVLLIEAGVKA